MTPAVGQEEIASWDGAAAAPTQPGGFLLGQLLRFGDLLRLMGVQTTLSQMLDLVSALRFVPVSDHTDFYLSARALLVSCREDLPIFDQAFGLFWRRADVPPKGVVGEKKGRRPRLPNSRRISQALERQGFGEIGPDDQDGSDDDRKPSNKVGIYSAVEILRQKDFREMSWEEIQASKYAMAHLKWRLGKRRTRRYCKGRCGRLNLRRLVRDNLAYGGEILQLSYRTRVFRPRPVVVLCDISGSMEPYARMLLHFIHSLSHGLTGVAVEAFVFSTRLTRITHHLRRRDVDESLDELGRAVLGWSGGTRIGEVIKEFNLRWARRVLGRGAVTLIISDGWDRGDAQLLGKEMARLQRSTHRLIWLNPLMGVSDYEPTQSGMAAALVYVDDFLPGRNLASLEGLAEVLSAIPPTRPERKQHPRRPAPETRSRKLSRTGKVKIAFKVSPEHLGS
jgi:uncharacterized protein